MQTSDQGRAFIREWEKLSLTVYADGVDKLTVGWGHLVAPEDNLRLGDAITLERADALFDSDVAAREDALARLLSLSVPLTQNEFDALVAFIFNVGETRFATSTLRRQLVWGAKQAAAAEFLRWDKGHKPDGTVFVVDGLTKRRKAEQAMFVSGIYDAQH